MVIVFRGALVRVACRALHHVLQCVCSTIAARQQTRLIVSLLRRVPLHVVSLSCYLIRCRLLQRNWFLINFSLTIILMMVFRCDISIGIILIIRDVINAELTTYLVFIIVYTADVIVLLSYIVQGCYTSIIFASSL